MYKHIVFALVALCLLVFAGCGVDAPQQEAVPTMRIGTAAWVGQAPLYLAQEKGYFEEEGVNVELITLDDIAQRRLALANGSLQGIIDTTDSAVLTRAQGVPAVSVLEIDVSLGADGIVVAEGIDSIADLKGKTIAAQKHFVPEAMLNYFLQQHDLSPDDVTIVDADGGAAGAAFVAGKVDAAVTYEPWLSKAIEREGGKVLVSSADAPGVIVDVLSVNETYLREHPEAVQKLMRAWFKALYFAMEYPNEANPIMAKHYDLPVEEFRAIINDGVVWPSYEENKTYFDGRFFEVTETFIDVYKKTGQVTDAPDMTEAVDGHLLATLYEKN